MSLYDYILFGAGVLKATRSTRSYAPTSPHHMDMQWPHLQQEGPEDMRLQNGVRMALLS